MVAKIMGIITKTDMFGGGSVNGSGNKVLFICSEKKKESCRNMNFLLMQMVLELSQYKEVKEVKFYEMRRLIFGFVRLFIASTATFLINIFHLTV